MIMMKQEVGSALDEVEERQRVETAETPGDDDCGNRVAQKGQRMLFFHSLSDSQFLTCTKCTPTQVEEVPDPGLRLTLSGSLSSRGVKSFRRVQFFRRTATCAPRNLTPERIMQTHERICGSRGCVFNLPW